MRSSEIREFYKKSIPERIDIVSTFSGLEESQVKLLTNTGSLEQGIADKLIENFITTMEIPMGIATNFLH